MKLPILFIALLVQTALSDQIKDGHLRGVNNRQLHSVSSLSPDEETTSFDDGASSGILAHASMEEASESSSLESLSRKHGHHGGAAGPCCSKMVAQTYDDHAF
jgi:hypothetical protein